MAHIIQPCLVERGKHHRHALGTCPHCASERLRAELAASRECEARMRALLQAADVLFAHHCRDCTALNWLDNTRAVLAEGAQG